MSRLVPLVSLVAVLAAPRVARAAACCGEVSTLGDRLISSEVFASSVGIAVRPRFGSYDAEGTFRSIPAGSTDVAAALFVDAVARVTPRLEIGASVDATLNVRESSAQSAVGGGVGDVRTRARFTVIDSADTRYWPGVSALVGTVVMRASPWARPFRRSSERACPRGRRRRRPRVAAAAGGPLGW